MRDGPIIRHFGLFLQIQHLHSPARALCASGGVNCWRFYVPVILSIVVCFWQYSDSQLLCRSFVQEFVKGFVLDVKVLGHALPALDPHYTAGGGNCLGLTVAEFPTGRCRARRLAFNLQ
jgi:hypothetical protein